MALPKLAFEVPKKYLDWGLNHCDYFFALAHLLGEWEYRDFIYRCQDRDIEIYLDNSAFELKESINLDYYFGLILELRPEVVVVPDVLGDLAKTIRLTRLFYEGLPRLFFEKSSKTKFMVVLQGQNNRERLRCLHVIRSYGYPFHIVGLPRHACPQRIELLHAIKRFIGRRGVHFLGLPDPAELKELKIPIQSLDTSWVAKYSIGKGANEYLDFENDEINEQKFIEGLTILKANLSQFQDV